MFFRSTSEHPDYVIDAVPGAREAFKEWQATLDTPAARRAASAHRAALDAGIGCYIYRDGRPVPLGTTSYAEMDAFIAAVRATDAAAAKFGVTTRAARAKFDRLFTVDALAEADVPAVAAKEALRLNALAAEAWATLQQLLPERDHAFLMAGSPGVLWSRLGGISAQRGNADWFYREAINSFDRAALEAVAGLGDLTPEVRSQLSQPRVEHEMPVS